MQMFARANEALREDLSNYAEVLRNVVATMPQVRDLCDQILKETRLVQALLAFANGQQVVELAQLAFHLGNLWPFRDAAFVRTTGFSEEIAETKHQREQAKRAVQMITKFANDDVLAAELKTCFSTMVTCFDEELRLLEECHRKIIPFTTNPDLTRKRLRLLIAAADARLQPSPEKQVALRTYSEAFDLLKDWESGVPLDERGVAILERCLHILNGDETFDEYSQRVPVVV
jgi:hypothetical protein